MDSNHLVVGHDHIGNCGIMSMNYYRGLEYRPNKGPWPAECNSASHVVFREKMIFDCPRCFPSPFTILFPTYKFRISWRWARINGQRLYQERAMPSLVLTYEESADKGHWLKDVSFWLACCRGQKVADCSRRFLAGHSLLCVPSEGLITGFHVRGLWWLTCNLSSDHCNCLSMNERDWNYSAERGADMK